MTDKCLVVTCGFFGDIIFATTLAEKLKSERNFKTVDYLIGYPQVERLVQNNPHIDTVYVSTIPSPHPVNSNINVADYAEIISLQPLNYKVPPAVEYQQYASIQSTSSEYTVYTEPSYDVIAKTYIDTLRENGKPVVAIMSNWEPKTYLFTEEQYKKGIDVPNLGYGGSHRNINMIVDQLKDYFTLIEVGVPKEYNQSSTVGIADDHQKSILFESSILKYCDAFVGTDGGLATIAAGVGTKTIITGDFNLQLYGWNGVLKQIENPQLGPDKYFTTVGHITISPYYNDNEVTQTILESISEKINNI